LRKRTPFKIRKGRASDKTALALVYQAAYSAEPFPEKWPLSSAHKRISQLAGKSDIHAWTVTVFRQPIGFAFLQVLEGFNGPYAELVETAIHPYFQNQGIGTALAKTLRDFQKKKRLRVVYSLAYRGMSEKFYRKAGFKPSKNSLVYVWK
jgi:GNAT superfamily N-acetyltransferase